MKNNELITSMIIDKMKNGIIPWNNPFRKHNALNRNFKSGNTYQGINQLMLMASNRPSPNWLTFKQALDMGGNVKKGSKGVPILFAKQIKEEDDNGNIERKNIFKRSYVFNMADIEGIECPYLTGDKKIQPLDFSKLEKAEEVFELAKSNTCKVVYAMNGEAFYNSYSDIIVLANRDLYKKEHMFYNVAFHEMIHSTGHNSRLNRTFGKKKADPDYVKEELVAEIGSAFMCNEAEILPKTIENSVAYCQSWIEHLKKDDNLIITASSKAQKAADYLLKNE
jgi:antirestriction protein ArdC